MTPQTRIRSLTALLAAFTTLSAVPASAQMDLSGYWNRAANSDNGYSREPVDLLGIPVSADGRAKAPVGNTVDVANATWTNTIGGPELIAVWKDPQFDATQRAFYYGRVIEIPTPRWTAY